LNKVPIAKCQNFRGQVEISHISQVKTASFHETTIHYPLPHPGKANSEAAPNHGSCPTRCITDSPVFPQARMDGRDSQDHYPRSLAL